MPKKVAKKSEAAAPGEPKGKKPPKGASSEVEQRWKEYWSCREELESACDAVRRAQEQLATATEAERERRVAFEQTKSSLKDLLEVESPSAAAAPVTHARVN